MVKPCSPSNILIGTLSARVNQEGCWRWDRELLPRQQHAPRQRPRDGQICSRGSSPARCLWTLMSRKPCVGNKWMNGTVTADAEGVSVDSTPVEAQSTAYRSALPWTGTSKRKRELISRTLGAGDTVKAAITKQRSFGDGQMGTGQPRGRGGCGGGAGCANSSLRGRRPHVPDATRSLSRLLKQQSPQASPERVGTRVPRPGQHAQRGHLWGGRCERAQSRSQCIYYPQAALVVRSPRTNRGARRDVGWMPGSGRPPAEGRGGPLLCSCLENPRDGGAWRAAVQGVTESDTTQHASKRNLK